MHIGEIGMAIHFSGGRAHGNKDRIGINHGFAQIRGKRQASCLRLFGHKVFQSGFINGDFTLVKTLYFVGIRIHADNIHAKFGKARAGDQPHISRTHNRDFHTYFPRV